jgi:two-component system, cell cycle sensor histidine kinase and response regulator CckA
MPEDPEEVLVAEAAVLPDARTQCALPKGPVDTPRALETQQHLALAVQSGHVGLWDWDLTTNKVFFSHEYKRQLGFADHEISDALSEWESRVHPDDLAGALARVNAYLKEPSPDFRNEFRMRHKDGSCRWILAQASVVMDESGKPARLLGSHIDITERKRAEEALRESEQRFKVALKNSPVNVSTQDLDLRYTWIYNPQLGYSPPEVVGKTDYDLLPPDTAEQVIALKRNALAADSTLREEVSIAYDGHELHYDFCVEPLHDQRGHLVGVTNVVIDITDRVESERALRESEERLRQAQKMEAVGQLAGGIAHDFNNLLTAIIGYSDLLLACQETAERPAYEDVREIRLAAERAAALTRQILAYSRRQALRPMVVSLNDVVTGMESLLRRTLGENIGLVTLLAPDLGRVEIDRHQFEQVILNLAVNGRDAMPLGGTLTLETGNVELDAQYCLTHPETVVGSHVMLAVSDTGMGIEDAALPHVFEPFFTTKAAGEGTGLGLATVHGIVKQSGGSIVVHSEPGKGTSFRIYLPRVVAPVEEPAPVVTEQPATPGGEIILVVEDEVSLRKLVARTLEGLGYRVMAAGTAAEALRVVEESDGRLDLLLTDVVLPGGLQGDALARELLASRPFLRVLFASGYTRDALVHSGRLDPGVNLLEKPFTASELAAMVRTVLDS